MQTAGGGFAGAVTSNDQIVDYQVFIDFPAAIQSTYQDVTKSTVSIDISRSITTSLPDGTSLISGYPTAVATIVLSGMLNQNPGVPLVEAQNIFWLMNPNDPTSPMYRTTRAGLPVTIQAGLWDGASTNDMVTVFTGSIDQVTCADGVVTLVCRDLRSTITDLVSLPPVITSTPYNAGLTSEFAIDYLLRHASPSKYLSWPAQRANCVLAVGFRSSLWPDVGSYSSFLQPSQFAPGVFGTALTSSATPLLSQYQLTAPITPAQSFFVEGWMTNPASSAGPFWQFLDPTGTYGVELIWTNTNHIIVQANSPGGSLGSFSLSISAGAHYISLLSSWPSGSGTCTCHVTIDGTTTAFTTSVSDTRPSGINWTIFEAAAGVGTLEALQVTTESAPASNALFSPTLVLDPAGSLNSLTALPDVSGQDTWSALQSIAAAEGGVIGFDELGICYFTNRQTIDTTASVRNVTSTASLMNLDSLEQMSLCATHIQQPVNDISIGAKTGVWNANSVIEVPGAGSLVLPIQTQNIVVNVDTTGVGFWPVSGPANVTSFRACMTADGTGPAVLTGVTQTVSQQSATQLTITIVNTNIWPIFMVSPASYGDTPAGTPFLFVAAQPVTAGTAVPVGGTTASNGMTVADAQWPPVGSGGAVSNTQFGEILLALTANTWVQNLTSATMFVDDLLADLFSPKPLWRNMQIVADPRLQLLDRVTVIDPDVSQINADGLIIGIETRMSAGNWDQTIDAQAFVRPGSWVLGVVGFSELNVTTWIY